jgi:hypothetical protein
LGQTLQEQQLPLVLLLLLQVQMVLLPAVELLQLLLKALQQRVPMLQLLQEELAAVSAAAGGAAAPAVLDAAAAAVLAVAPPECARLGCKQLLQQAPARCYYQRLLVLLHPTTAAAAAAGVPSWQSGRWCQLLLEEARSPRDPDSTKQQQAHMLDAKVFGPHTQHTGVHSHIKSEQTTQLAHYGCAAHRMLCQHFMMRHRSNQRVCSSVRADRVLTHPTRTFVSASTSSTFCFGSSTAAYAMCSSCLCCHLRPALSAAAAGASAPEALCVVCLLCP